MSVAHFTGAAGVQDEIGGVTITVDDLAVAMRLGSTTEELAQATRLRDFAITTFAQHLGAQYQLTPVNVLNEACVRFCAYLYDAPHTARGDGFANALRFSGAARFLLPYRLHAAGTIGEAVEAANAAVGTADNAVTDVSVSGSTLRITFADGTVREEAFTATGTAVDQTARDAAAAASSAAAAAATAAADATTTANGAAAAAATANTTANAAADAAAMARPMPATPNEAAAGTSTTIRSWTAALIRAAILAVVPAWARTGDTSALPVTKIADRSLTTEKYAIDSVDQNALGPGAVRRIAIDADAVGEDEIDDSILARIPVAALPNLAQATRGFTLRQAADGETWELVSAGSGSGDGAGEWSEMARVFRTSGSPWTSGVAIDADLQSDGTAVFADAAAVRGAIADGTIRMIALQRTDTEEVAIGINAPNFTGSAGADYRICCTFDGGDLVEVRFTAGAITFEPQFTQPSVSMRLDLAVFA